MLGRIKNSLKNFKVVRNPILNLQTTPKLIRSYHPNASHRNTDDNTPATFFDFTPDNYKRVS
jgi:hypothetical protein